MRRLLYLIPMFLCCFFGSAQTPTLVQHVSCPSSREYPNPQSSTPDYLCPLPEPSQAGNALLMGIVSSNNATFTVSDDKANTWALVDSIVDSNNDYVGIYVATNVAAGTRFIKLHTSANTSNVALSASEYYNVALSSAVDAHHCSAGSNTSTIAAGSITPAVAGDLLWQWAVNGGGGGGVPDSTKLFVPGSQSNIAWQFNGTDLNDGDGVQAGVYNSTSTINPTFTSGTGLDFTSCVMALKAAKSGNAPTKPFRIVHMLHQQMPKSAANPWPIQFPSSGNLVIMSALTGTSLINSVSSTPSNTWSSTGAPSIGGDNVSQIYYAANANTSNSLSLSVARSDNTGDSTFMMYDFAGAATSPFDVDSETQAGNQGSIASALTTCSSCLTPSGPNEVIISNFGQDWCTATGLKAPTGALFDSATFTGTSIDGPQPIDQNNGWMHYYSPGTSAITLSWTEACQTAQTSWAGRVAAFKAGQSVNQPPSPTGLTAVVQ